MVQTQFSVSETEFSVIWFYINQINNGFPYGQPEVLFSVPNGLLLGYKSGRERKSERENKVIFYLY